MYIYIYKYIDIYVVIKQRESQDHAARSPATSNSEMKTKQALL